MNSSATYQPQPGDLVHVGDGKEGIIGSLTHFTSPVESMWMIVYPGMFVRFSYSNQLVFCNKRVRDFTPRDFPDKEWTEKSFSNLVEVSAPNA